MSKKQKDIKQNTTTTDNTTESAQEIARRFFAEMQQGVKGMPMPIIPQKQH